MPIDQSITRIVMRDANATRWEATSAGFLEDRTPNTMYLLESFGFEMELDPFSFRFVRNETGEVLFDNYRRAIVMMENYLELGFTVPSQKIMGFGQHNGDLILKEGNYTIFNRDQPMSPYADGTSGKNLYGSHPFIMYQTEKGRFVGILWYNSNAQEIAIRFSKTGFSIIDWKAAGGIFDFYFFFGGSVDEVVSQYNIFVGTPVLPPFWSLGFHQCSWAYSTLDEMKAVVDEYTAKEYPIEAIWADIKYMDKYIDFTVDPVNWGGLGAYVDQIHGENMKFVPIIDAGIGVEDDSTGKNWFNDAKNLDVLIKSKQNPDNEKYGNNLIGSVWPGLTGFVDFNHPKAYDFWASGLQALHDKVKFDGLWLDMNEPSNFEEECHFGECPDGKDTQLSEKEDKSKYKRLKWWPGKDKSNYLGQKTISLDAYHSSGNKFWELFNTHNFFGTMETRTTR